MHLLNIEFMAHIRVLIESHYRGTNGDMLRQPSQSVVILITLENADSLRGVTQLRLISVLAGNQAEIETR